MIKFHGISMPQGAALSWPLSDIVIRRKVERLRAAAPERIPASVLLIELRERGYPGG
jgi:hypothetical protein